MSVNNKKSLKSKFDHLFAIISGERFLKMQGLGNEVPFFICPFSPKDTSQMNDIQIQLASKLRVEGVEVLTINLYDLSIALLREREIWDQIIELEQSITKDELKELLQGVLDPEAYLIPAIAEQLKTADFDVLFLTGVGEVFPYIRSHNVLNNLQSTAKHKPTVIFVPGAYSYSAEAGSSLDLFDKLHDDKYYRAFNIYHCEA